MATIHPPLALQASSAPSASAFSVSAAPSRSAASSASSRGRGLSSSLVAQPLPRLTSLRSLRSADLLQGNRGGVITVRSALAQPMPGLGIGIGTGVGAGNQIPLPSSENWWERRVPANMRHVANTAEFVEALGAAGDKLVVVDFFGTWCRSCRAMHPKVKYSLRALYLLRPYLVERSAVEQPALLPRKSSVFFRHIKITLLSRPYLVEKGAVEQPAPPSPHSLPHLPFLTLLPLRTPLPLLSFLPFLPLLFPLSLLSLQLCMRASTLTDKTSTFSTPTSNSAGHSFPLPALLPLTVSSALPPLLSLQFPQLCMLASKHPDVIFLQVEFDPKKQLCSVPPPPLTQPPLPHFPPPQLCMLTSKHPDVIFLQVEFDPNKHLCRSLHSFFRPFFPHSSPNHSSVSPLSSACWHRIILTSSSSKSSSTPTSSSAMPSSSPQPTTSPYICFPISPLPFQLCMLASKHLDVIFLQVEFDPNKQLCWSLSPSLSSSLPPSFLFFIPSLSPSALHAGGEGPGRHLPPG
ncbi:unnamed protein product [Closterium sp. NIES-54]